MSRLFCRQRVCACLILLFWTLCANAETASQRAERAFTRHAPVPSWVLRADALPDAIDAPFSVRLNDVQFRVDEHPATYVHRALVARDVGSLGGVANVELQLQPDYQTLLMHRLVVHRAGRADDRLDQADVRFLQREQGLEQGVYSGRVTVAIVVPDVRVGDTVELEYTTIGANPVFDGRFMETAHWDAPFPTAWRRIVLNEPAGQGVDYRLIGTASGPAPRITRTERDGRKLTVFEGRNLPALLADAGTPRDVQNARWLQFSQYTNWGDVDAWAVRLFQADVDAAALAPALATARRAQSQEEAAVAALEFVQNEIRYLSLSIGENSHRPANPADVLQRRYGDCKDKSLLLVTMLRALGLQADPVLVPVALHKGLAQYLPSPMLFDHAIVRLTLDGKTYFLDPTRQGQHGSLARLGQPLAGSDVLVAHAGVTRLDTIPLPAQPERQLRTEQVVVSAMDQPPRLTVRSEYAGTSAEMVRSAFAMSTQAELKKGVEKAMAARYPEAQLVGDVTMQDDRRRNVIVTESTFVVPHMFAETSTGWELKFGAPNLSGLLPAPAGNGRTAPLAVPGFPFEAVYDLDVRLPDGFAMRDDSQAKTIDDPAFAGARTLTVTRQGLHVKLALGVRADRVEAARVAEFSHKVQDWDALTSGSLRVFKADMRATPREQASEEDRLRASLARLDQAVKDAERTGREPGRPLCERARVRAWLGLGQDAVKDATRAVKLQDQATELLACRGEVYLLTGHPREAEADLTRSIARGQGDPAVYFQRGVANIYLGRRAEALSDFRQAAQAVDEGDRLAAVAMQASLGAAPAGTFRAEDGENAWLPVVLDVFAGRATSEHLVSSAMQGPRAGADARLTAAYYFAGRATARTNPPKARAYFERARDKRALSSIYYHAAGMELARGQP
jgi:transglutaminase-like putative cysteine protease/tetratricopeptide (TPR) repeat protein